MRLKRRRITAGAYKYYDTSKNAVTKYTYGTGENKFELEWGDDAASINWGVDWQIPSHQQCDELIDENYTTTTWTTLNGVNGRMIVSKINGNKIFLPAAGYISESSLVSVGSYGDYNTRSLGAEDKYRTEFTFGPDYIYTPNGGTRRIDGISVRPVRVQ